MPGSEFPDTPPPEVPEEFAAAYREAYLRALQSGDLPQVTNYDGSWTEYGSLIGVPIERTA